MATKEKIDTGRRYLTGEAADRLGVLYTTLHAMLRRRLIPAPDRSSGRYLWSEADLENARRALGVDRRRREHRTPGGAVPVVA